ncbi:DUF6888 family protein [Nostoc sp.]|uniref:DUF6888 family protein n=1 Tax=Nostoc sp. TaxID=1180 RepID=UPI003FA5955C
MFHPVRLNIISVTIEENNIYPTTRQALMCVIICQYLSNFYREIQLFRFSDITGNVFILAGDELQILVFRDGTWRFVNET